MISIGTGQSQPSSINPDSVNKVTWVLQLGSLITTVEQNTHDYLNKELLNEDYVRLQVVMNKTLELDSYKDEDIKELIKYG